MGACLARTFCLIGAAKAVFSAFQSFDGAAVIAPFVVSSTFADVTDIGIRLSINGEVRQDSNTGASTEAPCGV